jgi:hypothetical protein
MATLPAADPVPVKPAVLVSDRRAVRDIGWNPYEVWRTRVLLPRLAEQSKRLPEALPSNVRELKR